MLIIVTLTSIVVLTVLVWRVNRFLPVLVCPICAGVAGTWAWLMVAYFGGYQIELIIPAMLMGGTVVGVMSKLERLIELKFVLAWKMAFVVSGFLAMNSLITGQWLVLMIGIILAIMATLIFRLGKIEVNKAEPEKAEELKEKMKNCC